MSDILVNTGRIIKEYLDARGISQKELSARIGVSEKHISNLLKGKSRLTEEMALKLEYVMPEVSASYWLNYEQKYREKLARDERRCNLKGLNLEEIASQFHFKEVFKGLDWDLPKQADEMLKLLGISGYDCFQDVYSSLSTAFMRDGGEKEAIAIWLKLCEEQIDIQNCDLANTRFDKNVLENNLESFKRMALNESLDGIFINCKKMCNRLGMYLVIYPPISKCMVRGALRTHKGKPTIFLSGRFATLDHIWFAFFHEVGHLLLHYSSKYSEISFENENSKEEDEANEFAQDVLLDRTSYYTFVDEYRGRFDETNIKVFARNNMVHPSFVVARLQHDRFLPQDKLNYLKVSINTKEVFG